MDVVLAVIGTLVGVGGLAISVAGLRLQKQTAQNLEARERAVGTREAAIARAEASTHASLLQFGPARRAVLGGQVVSWTATVTNTSNQPFTHMAMGYTTGLLRDGSREYLAPGDSASGTLPLEGGPPDMEKVYVDITDSAARRWRRWGSGIVQPGQQLPDGTYSWGPADAPVVSLHTPLSSPPRPAGLRSEASITSRVVLALISAAVLAWSVATLIR